MPKIQVLDKHTAELIAAGEVVERPASVVKELMENAIDAGAGTIQVEIRGGGAAYIGITDNGCGIARDDVPTAFLRHATSKIRREEDLEAIGTLGFRGEALASIAAVARVELVTRTADELAGTRYVIEGGVETAVEDAGCPQGSTICVRDLFYNVPARLKFLKKDVSEANAVAGVVERVALSHPEVSVRFVREGREELLTPGDGDPRSCVYAVFGKEFAGGLIDVRYQLGGVGVTGFVCRPSASRSNRTMQHFFLNGRYVKTRTAMAALEQAYKGSLMVGKFPSCVLYLTMPAETVDVNVHPAKIEIRFINERPVFDAVYHAVKSALEAGDAPKQAVLPAKVPVAPPKPDEARPSRPLTAKGLAGQIASKVEEPVPSGDKPPEPAGKPLPAPLFPARRSPILGGGPAVLRDPGTAAYSPRSRVDMDVLFEENAGPPPAGGEADALAPSAEPDKPDALLPEKEPVIYLGEAFRTYILVQWKGSLYFVDKHAAHERLLYEELKGADHSEPQQLLAPVSVTLSREEYAALSEQRDLLEKAGFETEEFGGNTLLIRSVPMMLTGCDIPAAIQEIAAGFLAGGREVAVEKLDWIYHSTACRAAVKAGNVSHPAELLRLAERVLQNDDIRYCPHGRPVCFELTRQELEKQFGRIV